MGNARSSRSSRPGARRDGRVSIEVGKTKTRGPADTSAWFRWRVKRENLDAAEDGRRVEKSGKGGERMLVSVATGWQKSERQARFQKRRTGRQND